ncbi:MAG: Hsp70 family protein [Myxococcota bacterium]
MGVLGVDLGSTAVRAVYADRGSFEPLGTAHRKDGIPALGAIQAGELVFGEQAERIALKSPERAYLNLKRPLERGGSGVEPSEHGSVSSLFSRILSDLTSGVCAKDAVVAVPDAGDPSLKQNLRVVVTEAGFRVRRLVPDTICIAAGIPGLMDGLRYAVVLDAGASGVTVGVVEVASQRLELRATARSALGGAHIDRELMVRGLARAQVTSLDNKMLQALRLWLPVGKGELAIGRSISRSLDSEQGEKVAFSLNPEDLSDVVAHVSRSIEVTLADALDRANLGSLAKPGLVIHGGISRIPEIRAAIRRFQPIPVVRGMHPTCAVALGAAHLAQSPIEVVAPQSATERSQDQENLLDLSELRRHLEKRIGEFRVPGASLEVSEHASVSRETVAHIAEDDAVSAATDSASGDALDSAPADESMAVPEPSSQTSGSSPLPRPPSSPPRAGRIRNPSTAEELLSYRMGSASSRVGDAFSLVEILLELLPPEFQGTVCLELEELFRVPVVDGEMLFTAEEYADFIEVFAVSEGTYRFEFHAPDRGARRMYSRLRVVADGVRTMARQWDEMSIETALDARLELSSKEGGLDTERFSSEVLPRMGFTKTERRFLRAAFESADDLRAAVQGGELGQRAARELLTVLMVLGTFHPQVRPQGA